jgi:hypothetical protein
MNITLKRIFEVYVFALSFLFASRPISDPDFWFHLKLGQYIIQNGHVPHVDIFSCTIPGQPYVHHGWLSGVLFYFIYPHFGPNILIFLFAILTALAFWLVFKSSKEHLFTRGIAVLLGVWTVLPNIGPRPRVFTLLFVSVYFLILNSYLKNSRINRIWWLVPLMVLWVNLHGAFLIGLTLIVITIVGILVDTWMAHQEFRSAWPPVKSLGLVLIACLLATLLNPYGLTLYSHILGVLSSPVYQYVVIDWLPPDFHQSDLLPLIILILLTITVLVLSPKRVRPSELLFFIALLYMTLKMQRNAMIFALIAASLLADYSGPLWDTLFSSKSSESLLLRRGFRPAFLNLALLLPLLIFVVKLKTVVYRTPTQQMAAAPFNAVTYLKEKGIQGCTFTDPNVWGAYVMWAAPANPVFIDGRDVYPAQFVREYVEMIQGKRDWRGPFDQYAVKSAILTPSSVMIRQLKASADWQQVYGDDFSVVFIRR